MSHQLRKLDYRSRALELEATMLQHGALAGVDTEMLCPVNHSYADGSYIREWNSPPGVLVVSKIHKVAHPFFLMRGSISILTEDGIEVVSAPYHGITRPGTKRILFTHDEVQWVTVHVTEETDLALIEAQIIAVDFTDPQLTDEDITSLMESVK